MTPAIRERLLEAFEAAPMAVAVTRGSDHLVEYLNPAYCQVFGDPPLGVPAAQAFPELAEQGFLIHLDQVLATERPYLSEEEPISYDQDGDGVPEEHYFTFSCSVIKSAEEEPYGVLIVAVEVTGQVRVRQDLERQRERLALVALAAVRLGGTLDLEEALRAFAEAIVPRMARLCVIDLVEGDRLRRALVHNPGGLPALDQRIWSLSGQQTENHPAVRAWRTRQPVTLSETSASDAAAMYADPECRRIAAKIIQGQGVASVPLIRETEVIGVVSMVVPPSSGVFPTFDLALLTQLCVPAAEAIDNARRFGRQRRVAEVLQRSLLTPAPAFPGLDLAVRYRPAASGAEVGGDWYDAFHVPGDHLGVVIGDVIGHDLRAATAMGRLRAMVQAVACDENTPPAEVVNRVDRLTVNLSVTLLATMIYGHIERASQGQPLLRWANAGHPPPLVVSCDGAVHFLEQAQGLALGVDPSQPRSEAVEALPLGSTLILYTDGLVERREEDLDTGLARLAEQAAKLAREPVEQVCDRLLETAPTGDDLALLAVRVEERIPPARD
jgi:hypothetical protein